MNQQRRAFLTAAISAGVGGMAVLPNCATAARPEEKKPSGKTAEDVSPGEDLMREHGVLKRILLVYGEAIRRLDAKEDFPPDSLKDAAKVIREFVEDYHEKLEENQLFPRFKKANKLVGLVDTLLAQHAAGRRLTDTTLQFANARSLKSDDDRRKLATSLRQFIRMYNPHEAWEDTVLFPAFHEIVSQNEYDALGEDFEKKENDLFGGDGFEKNVARVVVIEKAFGLYDLAQFTPKE
jgi:hemerythrin-like domain-containing protein